ncbi:MAG: DDE-type integrase/transposase/recombinase, partial [Oscillospiraceae bacterium]
NMCLGIALADNMRTELCIQTYSQATENYDLRGAISHSDRGSQYTSEAFRQTLTSMGIIQSMNSAAGRCHDNAKCESMWARGKEEIMACQQLKHILSYYYTIYWNCYRSCSAIGGMTPVVKRGAFLEMIADKVA